MAAAPGGGARRLPGPLWPVLALVALYLLPLGLRPLLLPDEFRYAEVPREMRASGDWVVPRLDGFLYFEKPVLGYWGIAASEAVFGDNRFAVRLPSALAAALTALFLALLLRRGGGSGAARAAPLAALVFLTSLLAVGVGTTAVLDAPLTLFLTVALADLFLATESRRGSWTERLHLAVAGVACGLAFLTKGFLALAVPGLVMGTYLVLERRWRDLVRMPWLPVATAAAVAAPWSLAVARRAPDFWPFFFWHEHVQRFFGHLPAQHPEPWWFFLAVTPALLLPWTFLLPAAVRGWRRDAEPECRPLRRFAFTWFVVCLLFFSASSGKLATYMLPAFPAAAILLALGLAPWLERAACDPVNGSLLRPHRRGAQVGAACFALLATGGAVYLATQRGPDLPPPLHSAILVAGLVLAAAALLAAARLPLGRRGLLLVAGSMLPLLVVVQVALPQRVLRSKAPGAFLAAHRDGVAPDSVLLSDQNTVRAVSWVFRRHDVVLVGHPGELAFGAAHPSGAGRRLDLPQAKALIEANPGRAVLITEARKYRSWREQLPAPRSEDVEDGKGFAFVRY